MDEIVIKCLLAGDTFILKMRLRQPGFTYLHIGSVDHLQETKKKNK